MADSLHFDEEQDPDPDPHWSEKLNPDPLKVKIRTRIRIEVMRSHNPGKNCRQEGKFVTISVPVPDQKPLQKFFDVWLKRPPCIPRKKKYFTQESMENPTSYAYSLWLISYLLEMYRTAKYSGRGKFMPMPLKSKILETPGFLVTDYIKMFSLWIRTLNLQASLMVQCELSRISYYSATCPQSKQT